jgi:L-ascorbate 6-phosphate lactonase
MAEMSDCAGLSIRYLGQEGFWFRHGGVSVLVDPYLSHSGDTAPDAPVYWSRNYAPPVRAGELRGVDIVLCSHDHLDHTDPETLMAIAEASPGCRFAGPKSSVATMQRAGLAPERTVTLNAGDSRRIGEVEIRVLASAHESYQQDARGFHEFLGYVLLWRGLTLYHPGDTVRTEQLDRDLSPYRVDIGFLPINGRDESRSKSGIVGNMDGAEAIAFAQRHDFGLLVPMHYDLYSNNGASLPEFVALLDARDPKRRFKAFRPGEQIIHPLIIS